MPIFKLLNIEKIMSEVVIVTSRDELEASVEKALHSVMPKILVETQRKKDVYETDRLSISGAVDFLERGSADYSINPIQSDI